MSRADKDTGLACGNAWSRPFVRKKYRMPQCGIIRE